jgi:hypothetical protein
MMRLRSRGGATAWILERLRRGGLDVEPLKAASERISAKILSLFRLSLARKSPGNPFRRKPNE